MNILCTITPSIGADPEFFIASKKGKIIESNEIIPDNGLILNSSSKCTQDGVQAEINPSPKTCRQGAGSAYKNIFKSLAEVLNDKKIVLLSEGMIHLTQEELDRLSDKSKEFGCAPSINYYTGKESVIKANPNVYGYRSAGGHIHLGANPTSDLGRCMRKRPKLVIRLLDLILGNTCVMIDRDPNQVERRKVYGRAGEYRLPRHGIEYRTLSNFWIRSYQLMSMVYGFARLGLTVAYNIYHDELGSNSTKSCFREILKHVKKRDVRRAINNNDFNLAKKNWNNIKDILVSMMHPEDFGHFPINSKYLDSFEHFINKGLDYWFKDDILTHWTKNLRNINYVGWENFLSKIVTKDMECNGKISWSIVSGGFHIDEI